MDAATSHRTRRGRSCPRARGPRPARHDSAIVVSRYLDTHSVRKLHLGAGRAYLHGWLNTDARPASSLVAHLDVTETFPFDAGTFDYVFCEHMIEHLTQAQAAFMLGECRRTMRGGGIVRIATPNLSALVALLGPSLSKVQQKYVRWISKSFLPRDPQARPCHVVNNAFYNWGHRFIYDAETLTELLRSSGFVKVVERRVGHSPHRHLAGLESHGKLIADEELNRYETVVLEAARGL